MVAGSTWNGHKWVPPKKPIPCFINGSSIITRTGPKLVEKIRLGDKVLTRDNGFQEVLWVGHNTDTHDYVDLGYTRVSKQHRMLLLNKQFGDGERLIPAVKLARITSSGSIKRDKVTFIHFMFKQHEIVNVDETWSESFYPGPYILQNDEIAKEIYTIFPDLSTYTLARNLA